VETGLTEVWLKSPPTPLTIISSPYQLNKHVEPSGEMVNVYAHLTFMWMTLESQMQTVETRQ